MCSARSLEEANESCDLALVSSRLMECPANARQPLRSGLKHNLWDFCYGGGNSDWGHMGKNKILVDQKPTIIVVEDTALDEQLTLAAIGGLGFEVTVVVARDGEEALKFFRGAQADLILLDIKLPKLNGLSLLEWIRTNPRLGTVPVVIVSNSDEPGEVRLAYERGASGYVFKPTDPDAYLRQIKAACLFWLRARLAPSSKV